MLGSKQVVLIQLPYRITYAGRLELAYIKSWHQPDSVCLSSLSYVFPIPYLFNCCNTWNNNGRVETGLRLETETFITLAYHYYVLHFITFTTETKIPEFPHAAEEIHQTDQTSVLHLPCHVVHAIKK